MHFNDVNIQDNDLNSRVYLYDNEGGVFVNNTINNYHCTANNREPLKLAYATKNILIVDNNITNSSCNGWIIDIFNGVNNVTFNNNYINGIVNTDKIVLENYNDPIANIYFNNNDINGVVEIQSGQDSEWSNNNITGSMDIHAPTIIRNSNIRNINITKEGLVAYGNVISGLVTDNIPGSKWCDYNTYTGNTYTTYNGVNIPTCPKVTEFNETTDFSTIQDWSNLKLYLSNDEGAINYSENINMSGIEAKFDDLVKIEHNSIEVETNEYNNLDKPAVITFKNVNPTTEGRTKFVLHRNGEECPSNICLSQIYDEETQTYTVVVTGFSTYDLEYDEILLGNAITGMAVLGSDMGGFLSSLAPGIGVFILLLGIFGGVVTLVYAIAGGLKKKIDKKYK